MSLYGALQTPSFHLSHPILKITQNLETVVPRFLEARTGFEPVMTVLQTGALPLGYRATFIKL